MQLSALASSLFSKGTSMRRLSPPEIESLTRLGRGAILASVIFAILAVCTNWTYALHLCLISALVAAVANLATNGTALVLLVTFSLFGGCATVDLSTERWVIRPTRAHVVGPRLRVTPPDELDQLVSGCNAYLLKQRDEAANDEQRVRKRQRVIAIIAAAVTVAVGSTALVLKSYNRDKDAALTGGIGSVVTGALSGTGIGLLVQPDASYEKRRDAIMTAWGSLTAYSTSTSQPDPEKLAGLKQRLREACAGMLPR